MERSPETGTELGVPLGTADVPDADDSRSARERAKEACETLIGLYAALEQRLRDNDLAAIGWRPHLAALRSMRDGELAGDVDELARLLVDADESDVLWDGSVEKAREILQGVLAEGERALVVAPTEERAAQIVGAAGDEVLGVLLAISEVKQAVTTVPEPPAPPREAPSSRTVTFGPPTSADLTRPQELPEAAFDSTLPDRDDDHTLDDPDLEQTLDHDATMADDTTLPDDTTLAGDDVEATVADDDPALEAQARSVVVRPMGEAWLKKWRDEARTLQRGLMWLEQWPRDKAALETLETARERRQQEIATELSGLEARIEETRNAVTAAEQATTISEREVERLQRAQDEIVQELEGPRSEAQRLQAQADATADEAGRLTRTAEATLARCNALEERNRQAQAELGSARQQEETLTADLTRARQDLPRVAEEADQLMSDSAKADAEGHTRYYRLAAAESALGARRRKLSLGQRLHVAPPPAELKQLRAEVKALTRETTDAAKRASEAKEAADRAQGYRTQLETFLNEGASRLAAAQEAQRQLSAEIDRLARERTAATADHQEKAQLAAEAVNRATQASALAVQAQKVAREIEVRLASARQEHHLAQTAYQRAQTEAAQAKARLSDTEALLVRRRDESEREMVARSEEFAAATAAEERSRQNVERICGETPADRDALARHQRRAMEDIERLTAYLDGAKAGFAPSEKAGRALLGLATLVCGTPLTVGAAEPPEEFDALVVAGAAALNEADFLIGAVRARHWIQLGFPGDGPPAHGGRLGNSPFASRP